MQALWMVLASFFFATMAVGIKVASSSFNLFELVFYRGLVSIVFMVLALRARGIALKTPVPWMHAWRTVVGVTAMAAWFYAIAHLPLATAMTLNYMSGIWVAVFVVGGALLYGKATPQGPLLGAVLAGFAGVVVMLRPTLEQSQLFAGLVGLLSGLMASLAYLQVTALGKVGEPNGRTVFYFAVGTSVIGLIGASWVGWSDWASVRWQAAAWLVPLGVLASLGQWSLTRAFSRGATLLVANLQYSGIIFAALYSLWLLGDPIDPLEGVGMAIIVGSGIVATALRNRVLPDARAEEH